MLKKALPILQYLFFLSLGIFLVWWSLQQIPAEKWDEFKASLRNANYWLLIPVFFILSGSHVLRALRWRILIRPMGYNPSLPNSFFAVMVGYLANLAVPRLGEVLKCTILSRYEKVPADKLIGTILIERVFDVICLGIVFAMALVLQYDIVGAYGKQLIQTLFENKTGEVSATKLLVFTGILTGALLATIALFKKYSHLGPVKKVVQILQGIWEGLGTIRRLKEKGLFLLYSTAIWALYIGGTWVGLWATSGTAGMGFPVSVSALAFASIGMIVTPGGIGAYAYFLAKVLEKNGVSFEMGFANGTLQWFAQFIIVILVGFISLGLLPWYNKKRVYESNTGR